MPELALHCFRASHFNEKAHWALAQKGLDYETIEHWPGPHMRAITKLSGQSATPVLEIGDRVVSGSTPILLALEELAPDPALFPEDPGERAACLELMRWLDEEVGPAVRLALFFDLLDDLDYTARIFVREPWGLRERLYRAALPAIRMVMRKEMDITADTAVAARQTIAEATKRITERAGPTGHLVGDRFTAADLTAASLLAILCYPPGFHAPLPEPPCPQVEAWLAEWEASPAGAWVGRMYAEHRPT